VETVKSPRDDIRPRSPLKTWFDVRKRSTGSFAFALNRLTGIGLIAYLLLHLVVLSLLLKGEQGWDAFIALARSPLFLMLEVILIFGVLYHGLNGIRVALVGMGIGVKGERTLFWLLMMIGLGLLIVAAWLVFTL
jgi:succinate dehydrogenase / fumarate reductase cytochrome b subunit